MKLHFTAPSNLLLTPFGPTMSVYTSRTPSPKPATRKSSVICSVFYMLKTKCSVARLFSEKQQREFAWKSYIVSHIFTAADHTNKYLNSNMIPGRSTLHRQTVPVQYFRVLSTPPLCLWDAPRGQRLKSGCSIDRTLHELLLEVHIWSFSPRLKGGGGGGE